MNRKYCSRPVIGIVNLVSVARQDKEVKYYISTAGARRYPRAFLGPLNFDAASCRSSVQSEEIIVEFKISKSSKVRSAEKYSISFF